MKKQALFLSLSLIFTHLLFGQSDKIEREDWVAKPSIHKIDDKYAKESAVILFDKRRQEYIDDPKGEVKEYYTLHKIVHVNDDRGIEMYNKIYLGIGETTEVVDVRARTILPNGKIIELDKNNIKDLKEDDGNIYKIFAMEGLEKGSEIEYLYTYSRPISYFGREIIQGLFPIMESQAEIIGPERLRFEIKPYNCSVSTSDTVLHEKRFSQTSFKDIQGLEDEKYSFYHANLQRIEFKLSYNDLAHKGERLFTWNTLAKRMYGLYATATEKESKKVADLMKENKWADLPSEEEKIIAVENFLKKKFYYNENLGDDQSNMLDKVIQNKTGGSFGIMRLYSSIFQQLGIKYQLVFTGNRDKYVIDKDFENWNNCDNPLIYFNAENKFIAPTKQELRYPWIEPTWGATNALFCKQTTLGSFTTAIAEVKQIDLEKYDQSFNNIECRIELNKTEDSLIMDTKQLFSGYSAIGLREPFNFATEEQKRQIIKELSKFVTKSENITFSEVLNPEFENENTNKPLIIHTKANSAGLIERAGSKLLIKMGLAIGPQVEMYQDKPRQMRVDLEYPQVEERKIELVIPDGYKVLNLDDFKIDHSYSENGVKIMGFTSTVEVKGNIVYIHVMEVYRQITYPLSLFEQYRKVINASSDFNKGILVLEKQ